MESLFQLIKMEIWGDNLVNGENKIAAPLINGVEETEKEQEQQRLKKDWTFISCSDCHMLSQDEFIFH